MAFVIEKNVPLPQKAGGRTSGSSKYPFVQMAPGDSFFVAGKTLRTFGSTVGAHRKKYGGKFTCRTVEGGVRVWRLE